MGTDVILLQPRVRLTFRAAQFFWMPDGGRSESSLMGISETSRRPGRADETSKFRATGSQNVVHGALGVVLERRKLSTFIKSRLLSPEKLDSGHKSREEAGRSRATKCESAHESSTIVAYIHHLHQRALRASTVRRPEELSSPSLPHLARLPFLPQDRCPCIGSEY